MSRNTLLIIGVILVLLIGGVLFINNSKTSPTPSIAPTVTESSPSTQVSPEQAMLDASSSGNSDTMVGTTKEFTVMGSNYKFEPATLSVNKGDKVKITFKNTGGMHNFMIEEFDAQTKTIQSGQEATVEFVANKSGSFEYYCSVGNHRQMGMKGTLVVK